MPTDPQVINGRIVRGTPLFRLNAEVGAGESDTVTVLVGDIRDLCKTLDPKNKKVAGVAAKAVGPVAATVELPTAEVQALVELAVGQPAKEPVAPAA